MYSNEKIYKASLLAYIICWIGMIMCVRISIYDYLTMKTTHPIEIIIMIAMTIIASCGMKEVLNYFIFWEVDKYVRENNKNSNCF